MSKTKVEPATGRLGVMCVGLGAVTTTTIIGTLMARKGLSRPIGSFACNGIMRLGTGSDKVYKEVKDIIPVAHLDDMVFGAWDIYEDDAYEAAIKADVLKQRDIDPVADELHAIKPYTALYEKAYATNIDGPNVKSGTLKERTEALREDIRRFKAENHCDRVVVIWIASTEKYVARNTEAHDTLTGFEAALERGDTSVIAPSMCYAYAALAEGAPFIMGAPNTTVDIPAMWELAEKTRMPIAGKDFKTGQTLVKSGFAPIIGTRCLGLNGWFSTNILGNRDGLVLDEPENFRTKEVSKLSTLESILVPEAQPDLYTDYYHKVRINYYPPRNDDKEGWDNIDIFGWMGYPMQIKINFLCRDSILAAPLLLDLCLLSDLAARAGRYGIQRFLSFYLKSPMYDYRTDEVPVNHLFQQYTMLKNAIREMGGYEADEEID